MGCDPLRVFSAVHVAAGHAGQANGGSANSPAACSAFQTCRMHWTPRDGVFGIDGLTHFRYVKFDLGARAWPFDAPQLLLLNLAIGGDLGGPVDDRIFPVTLEVDIVRVYQRAP